MQRGCPERPDQSILFRVLASSSPAIEAEAAAQRAAAGRAREDRKAKRGRRKRKQKADVMGFQNIYATHPKHISKGGRCCRVCSNRWAVIRKYDLNICRQCFRWYARSIGFEKVCFQLRFPCIPLCSMCSSSPHPFRRLPSAVQVRTFPAPAASSVHSSASSLLKHATFGCSPPATRSLRSSKLQLPPTDPINMLYFISILYTRYFDT